MFVSIVNAEKETDEEVRQPIYHRRQTAHSLQSAVQSLQSLAFRPFQETCQWWAQCPTPTSHSRNRYLAPPASRNVRFERFAL